MPLSVVLSNTAGVPIYEQIAQQVRDAILTGQVEADEMLPSIRALARDLRQLTETGYAVRHVQPVDMFPHTNHVETVVLLTKEEIMTKKRR